MANNFTWGHEIVLSSSESSGVHTLNVALAAGSASIGTVTLAANSGVDIGDVDVTSIAASETHIGSVGGHGTIVAQTPTITAGAYSAKDAVGGLLTFANATRTSGGTGVLHAVTIIDDASQSAELVLVLFNQTFTATSDNGAFDPSDADLENCIGKIKIAASDYNAFADNAVASKVGIGLPIKLTGTSLFGQLMCTGTPTYAATADLTVKVHILQD